VNYTHTKPWVNIDEDAIVPMAAIVGAKPEEVAIMQTLTANLHLLLLSFYKPTKERYKIIIESKAFPSDHFAIQSQLAHHDLSPEDALVLITPSDPETHTFSTEHILATIDEHATGTALIILPGIQFYTGQFLDIPTITAHAHSKGILIGWDLAHAAGNVPLQLHDWNVDFAVWCTYKYLNSGPGSMGALFVHERHGASVTPGAAATYLEDDRGLQYRPRLAGWWGSTKDTRFDMTNEFVPIPGARGWQLSNPSVLDMTSIIASLSVFSQTDMAILRRRSLRLTAYLEYLLLNWPHDTNEPPYILLTPRNPHKRGAQISIKLKGGILDDVLRHLTLNGVVVDERKPDVIRVAPAPLYNTFLDVWKFVTILWQSLPTHSEDQSESHKRQRVQ
jgi:kynureninase